MGLETIRVGIVFNGIVTALVAMSALLLIIFLLRRWAQLDLSMRAYVWFWIATMFVWIWTSVRYLFIGFNYFTEYEHSLVYYCDILIQISVFLTGPALFYYLGTRVFRDLRIAQGLSFVSAVLALTGIGYILLPGGIIPPQLTYFSADATINAVSFGIFSVEAIAIFFLLIVDVMRQTGEWRKRKNIDALYQAFYSVALLIYVLLGSFDQAKLILDWPLIVFRLSYIGAFLMAYVTTIQHEASHEEYLIEDPTPI